MAHGGDIGTVPGLPRRTAQVMRWLRVGPENGERGGMDEMLVESE